jgi:hypothetical protein
MTKLAIGRQEDPASAGFFFAPKCHDSSITIDVCYWPKVAPENTGF